MQACSSGKVDAVGKGGKRAKFVMARNVCRFASVKLYVCGGF